MSEQNKRWDGLTFSGTLKVGVFYAGVRHTKFTLRVPVAGDLIVAQEKHPNGPMQLVTLEVYRQQLMTLGDIPGEALTTELLRTELTEIDLAQLADADTQLEKKLGTLSGEMPTGAESNMPLSATATE